MHSPFPEDQLQQITEIGRHLHLMKSFTPLRRSEFRFTGPSDPAPIAVHDTITGDTPTINLSDPDANIIHTLDMLLEALSSRASRRRELHSLKDRLTEAVGNIDVYDFLQTRFDILRTWVAFDVYAWAGNGKYHSRRDEYWDLARIQFERCHVWDSLELECSILEDGDRIN